MKRISSNANYKEIEQFFDEVREEEIDRYLDSLDEEEEE